MDYRLKGYGLLRGQGLEIGALNSRAILPAAVEIEYCDRMSRAQATALFPELDPSRLPEVDHVFDVDEGGLSRFGTGSRDFIIATLVIDHLANPIGFLEEAFRIVRPGGHVVLSVPDAGRKVDQPAAVSEFEYYLDIFRRQVRIVDDQSYENALKEAKRESGVTAIRVSQGEIRQARLRREAVHVWTAEAFREFISRSMKLLGIEAECVYERDYSETGLEYFTVWQSLSRSGDVVSRNSSLAHIADVGDSPVPSRSGAAATADREPARPSGVLLCGMHRSGTSVLARALGVTGLWMGEDADFLPPHAQDNPEGYWERRDVYDAHIEFMHSQGYDWDRLAGYGPVDAHGEASQRLKARLRPIVSRLSEQGPWLLKDPRLSLLLPVWFDLVPDAIPVVAVRHPLEIAASLSRSHRGVYPNRLALVLWEKYLLRTLKDLRGRPAVFVSYHRLTASPGKEIARVVRLLEQGGLPGLRVPEDGDVINRDLHRNRIEHDVDQILDRRQSALLERLQEACEVDGFVGIDVDGWPEPDVELAEFEESFQSRIADRIRAASGPDDRMARVEQLGEMILAQVRDQKLTLLRENAALARGLEARSLALADMKNRLAEAKERCESSRQAVVDIGRSKAELASRIEQYDQAIRSLKTSFSWRLSAPVRWVGRIASLRLPAGAERWLHGVYYRFPLLNARRKRAVVLWMHEHMPWLTRNTISYQLYQAARKSSSPGPGGRGLQPLSVQDRQRLLKKLSRRPLISILMPTFNTRPEWLAAAIESLRNQSYPEWELCIADDASTSEETRRALAELDDSRIKLRHLDSNVGIAMASNAALSIAKGDYVALLDHDDELAPDALLEVAVAIDRDDPDFVYSDEDKIDFDGSHAEQHFKPDYSPDLFLSCNYVCHLSVMRRSLLNRIGGFRTGFDGAQDYDLFLRYLECASKIVHIPKILYHWRMHESSTAAASAAKPKSWDAGQRALTDALSRRGMEGHVEPGPFPNTYRVRRAIRSEDKVSVIIPFRDRPELLEACVTGVLKKGGYHNVEVLLVDNGSVETSTKRILERLSGSDRRVRVCPYDVPFNYSRINNWAARQADGDVLLFLNNDIEPITHGWIASMLEHAQRPEVAVVGARLLYPDDTVQHAGVIVGLGGIAGHAHLYYRREHPGYFCRSRLTQNFSAVTFACAMVRRKVYEELDGLDEHRLTIAFNDVDFCLRARERGYLVVYDAFAELYHHESKSRGSDDTPEKSARFSEEINYMQSRHQGILSAGDPYYNPNLSLSAHTSFSVDP